jgi:hypothetical protein
MVDISAAMIGFDADILVCFPTLAQKYDQNWDILLLCNRLLADLFS